MIKTSNQNSNRIVGISSDDFFHLNTKKDIKKKDVKSKKNNKQTRKNLSVEKPKKFVNKKESNKQKTTSNSKSLKLPDVFFEQILEYELQLKLKFDPKVFFELINLYSSAIKFYESIKNDKFITYNLGLNMLFAMPEVKSFMDGEKNLTKTEKKENIEKKMQQSEQKITKDKIETMYQSRINKNKKGKNIIKDDFNKQAMSFKKRMKEKKKKYISSLNVIPSIEEENNSIKIISRNNNKNNNKFRNKSVDIIKPKFDSNNSEFLNDEEINEAKKFHNFTNKKSHQININFSIEKNNFFDETEKEDIRNDINNINKLSLSGSGTDSEKDTLSFTTSDNMIIDLSKKHKFTNKTLFKEKLKVNFDVYICQYYNKFIENTMNDILDDYCKCGEEFEKKLYDNSIEFFNQKKELESLLKIDDEDNTNYNDQIKKAVEELKKEENDERDKILEEGSDKVDKLNEKYDNIKKLNDDHYLDIIKEKLKLDVMKSLNSNVFK
jgi:hypothetical protein